MSSHHRTGETAEPSSRKLADLERNLGYTFHEKQFLRDALTHASSTAAEEGDNERLEFLGDAVLSLAIAEYLFHAFSGEDEGEMTRIRSYVVSRMTLARRAEALHLGGAALLGRGISANGELPTSVAANLFEGVVAAIYFDGGYAAAREFVLDQLAGEIEGVAAKELDRNYKSRLQQYAQTRFGQSPQYRVLRESGPNHDRVFEISVQLGGRRFPPGAGHNKKEAEQAAARSVLIALGRIPADAPPADAG